MTTITENTVNEEKRSLSFVEQLVEEDLAAGKNGGRIQTRFPQNPTDTCILDMPKLSVWTLVLQNTMAVYATCVSTTQTRQKKTTNM